MSFRQDVEILDSDIGLLQEHCSLLDLRLAQVQQDIESSFDPDQMGLFDDAEYVSGIGFVAIQQYLTSVFGLLGTQKENALEVGPRHRAGKTIAQIVNAIANYWKHRGEWDVTSTVLRSTSGLTNVQLGTLRTIETVTQWADYTCTNVLASLSTPGEPRFENVLTQIEEWRDALHSQCWGT